MKRWLYRNKLMLALMFLVSMITSCSMAESELSEQWNPIRNLDAEDEAEVKADQTFSLYSFDPSPNWNDMQDDVGQEIMKRSGVKLDMDFFLHDSEQHLAFMTLSKDYPDLIMPKGDADLLVEADALIDLRPLIDQYAPNLKKVYEPYMNRLRWSEEDPSIYILPNLFRVGQEQFDAGGTFAL